MLKIDIPEGYTAERTYVIELMLGDFLGLDIELSVRAGISVTRIHLENDNVLEVKDAFFREIFHLDEDYLNIKYIPAEVVYCVLDEAHERNLVCIYGQPEIVFEEKKIYCGIDLFASAFFMLSRWEEHVCQDRDMHGRFPAKSSLACRRGFLSRPVVNEYVEVIWQWLEKLDIRQDRKQRRFRMINTHDIDKLRLFQRPVDYIGKPAKAFFIEKKLSALIHHSKLALQSLAGKDPYLVFDYFMDISERYDTSSHFFFMAGGKSAYDDGYDIEVGAIRDVIGRIADRDHVIGIHPSYNTFNNPEMLSLEINRLRELTGADIVCGRQHYLRFRAPDTWQYWDDNNMQWDSSLAYQDQPGFRCGTCYPYTVFNFFSKKKLALKERPLTIMDATLAVFQHQSPQQAIATIDYYLDKVERYSGEFVLLWHNSSFEYLVWNDYRQVFEHTVRHAHALAG